LIRAGDNLRENNPPFSAGALGIAFLYPMPPLSGSVDYRIEGDAFPGSLRRRFEGGKGIVRTLERKIVNNDDELETPGGIRTR
jgi:hypothetical protein